MSRRHTPRSMTVEDAPEMSSEEAHAAVLSWPDEISHVTLDVCKQIFRTAGARFYASHRDASLRADLEDWLIVQAVELAQTWHPRPVPADVLPRAWGGYLTFELGVRARWHFRHAVSHSRYGSEPYMAAVQAHRRIASTEALDEMEAETGARVARYALHGDDCLLHDPAVVHELLERLAAGARDAERRQREQGIAYSTESKVETGSRALCSEPECQRVARVKGLCRKHYSRAREHWGSETGSRALCSEPECQRVAYSKGLCKKHYNRAWARKKATQS